MLHPAGFAVPRLSLCRPDYAASLPIQDPQTTRLGCYSFELASLVASPFPEILMAVLSFCGTTIGFAPRRDTTFKRCEVISCVLKFLLLHNWI